jgi:hypothetical protein
MRGDDLDPFFNADELRGDDEGGKPARPFAFAGAREGQVEVGDAAVGDVGLLADDHPLVAVAHGGGLNVGRVRAALRLGHGESSDRFAGSDARKPFALLLDGAEQGDRTRTEALHGKGEIGERAVIGEGLTRDGEAAHVGTRVAVGDAQLEESGASERGDELLAMNVERIADAVEVRLAPALQRIGELAVARFEERPGEVCAVDHPALL